MPDVSTKRLLFEASALLLQSSVGEASDHLWLPQIPSSFEMRESLGCHCDRCQQTLAVQWMFFRPRFLNVGFPAGRPFCYAWQSRKVRQFSECSSGFCRHGKAERFPREVGVGFSAPCDRLAESSTVDAAHRHVTRVMRSG